MNRSKNKSKNKIHNRWALSALLVLSFTLASQIAVAGAREQAKRMHDRLAGVPPTEAVLSDMTALISSGNEYDAAMKILSPDSSDPIALYNDYKTSAKYFYSVTLKNMVTPWTNEAQTVFAPLNDYTATVIGMVRDEVPFNQLLSANIVYVGAPGVVTSGYSMSNNTLYEQLEDQAIDLSDSTKLVRVAQTDVTDLPANATAGIMTTRAAARAFFVGGTNRAMFRFTILNHFCNDLEQIKDNSRSPDRVRQDVSRSPGGDSRIYMNACVACHAGMDPMAQAYAYYEWQYTGDTEEDMDQGSLIYTEGSVQPKYLINADTFKYGFVTTDDRWDNYWRAGPNSLLGWDSSLPGSGNGAKSMGMELANSDAFASCQVKKVYQTVCFREPSVAELTNTTSTFKAGYNLKQVFAQAAADCMGN
jgi:hypothetical protein